VASEECAILSQRLIDLNIAYSSSIKAGQGQAANLLASAIRQVHNELVTGDCVKGLLQVPNP
jgi:hypothetical protein